MGPRRVRAGSPLLGRPGRLRRARQGHVAELAILLHGLEGPPVDEDHSAPPEVRAHVDALRVEPGPIAGHVRDAEGVVGIGKQRAGELVPPDPHRALAAPRQRLGARLPAVPQDFGRLHDDGGARRRLVADHPVGSGAAARRTDALPVRAGRDHDALAGLQDLRRLPDRAKRPLEGTRAAVVPSRRAAVDVVGPGEAQGLLPEGEFRAVRKPRVAARLDTRGEAHEQAEGGGEQRAALTWAHREPRWARRCSASRPIGRPRTLRSR